MIDITALATSARIEFQVEDQGHALRDFAGAGTFAFDGDRLVGANCVGFSGHVGAMRGMIEGRLRLGVTTNYFHSLQNIAGGDGLWGAARQQTGFGTPYDSSGALIVSAHTSRITVTIIAARSSIRSR